MQLTKNQEVNINSIVAMSINGYYNGLNITSINHNNDEYIINISRYLTDKYLNKLNSYFNVNIKDKYVKYELIVNKNADICRLSILNIDKYQLDMFSNETNELDILINDYNSKITNN